MKKAFLATCSLAVCLLAHTQLIDPKEAVRRKATDRANSKIDQSVDKGLDKVEEGIGNIFKKKKKEETNNTSSNGAENGTSEKNASNTSNNEQQPTFAVYSKFDFVPGEKVLYYEDFEATEVGDFPTGWNTNSSAEIIRFDNLPAKWLSMTKDGFFQPEMVKDLPENFTLEFDIFNRYRAANILDYKFIIYKSSNPRKDVGEAYLNDAFIFNWAGCTGGAGYSVYENGEKMGGNDDLTAKGLECPGDEYETPISARFSIWRQKNRLRIYVNHEKVLDVPQAFNSNISYNVFKLGASYMNYANGRKQDDQFMVSNIRYAVGAPDTRNKLITTGKFSTNGILFDVNSANIKPSSYGILKQIATSLKENAEMLVKIIGHTDSDGDEASNLILSKKRAAAVKTILTKEFGITESRMETDGKGESEPLVENSTPQGKANNRRVEFIKRL